MSPAADRGIAPLALALVLLVVLSGCTSSSPSPPVVDAALEWYTGGDLVVDADLAPSLVDWYVGAGLGYLFAADERADLPPPFRDGDPADDRAWRGLAGETAGNATTPAMTPRRTQEFPSVARE